MRKFLKSLAKDVSGASAAEYAVLLTIIAAGVGAAVTLLGTNISAVINAVAALIAV